MTWSVLGKSDRALSLIEWVNTQALIILRGYFGQMASLKVDGSHKRPHGRIREKKDAYGDITNRLMDSWVKAPKRPRHRGAQ